jgi:hypothetical protein
MRGHIRMADADKESALFLLGVSNLMVFLRRFNGGMRLACVSSQY